ncbi:hypothetical protein CEUSTIGMA_g4141.t1 [Chlamydomonas eustigma]|uniref:Phosphoglycerate mutase n=1 Tax=Chlamydomonas eustigma TaxID=1157962 RepID=A0A250X0W9_9CHLO|nr:hypothetical protein CEUSTIGMA_g4141.t1 [Chlamydomonas eustigma]|eukprot:GAX76695.1 hypothetical protein CEUSTIGMA_g4141.t1 [Chlamydomonas eustigma]
MKNTYWLLRHGKSLANEAGIIISKKENGVSEEWRLAAEGREQALSAGELLRQQLAAAFPHAVAAGLNITDAAQLQVYCSPFSRTKETAILAAGKAGLRVEEDPGLMRAGGRFQVVDSLMERDFGMDLEKKPYGGAYEALWEQDAQDSSSRAGKDGESVADVSIRIKSLFKELESRHDGVHILLVGHGDTLSILQATMEGADIREHRKYAFKTGELRLLLGAVSPSLIQRT